MPKVTEWKRYFSDKGVESNLIEIYLARIEILNSKKVPVVFEFEHLSLLLGINRPVLAKIVNSPSSFYRKFSIPKRDGRARVIFSPYPSLLQCQRWVLKNILEKIPVHEAVHGFRKGRSILTNATVHMDKSCLLKMDIKDFFPSVPINWVINLFRSLGYPNNVSFYLAAICCADGSLAQGAATSPALSNILLSKLDERIFRISKENGLNYTRYADDLVFSGDSIPENFHFRVRSLIRRFGLMENKDKTRIYNSSDRKLVTGLHIKEGKVTVPRSFRRDVLKEVFYIKKYGFLSHASKIKLNDPGYLFSLNGRIGFWLFVEPDNPHAIEARDIVQSLLNVE